MNLVIVESPAKSKTIEKYLGKGFEVMASYGHIRDLVPKAGAVETDNDFHMRYELIKRSSQQVNKIIAAFKKSDNLYLATDPDREGEAISWHLREILKEKGLLDGKGVYRVVFHEITQRAVREAFEHPRELSDALIDAQQARRALDYLVGFNLSPLLWRKIQGGLSAGRVQSPALRMIVERELEIEAFKPREYWTIWAQLADKDGVEFMARLYAIHGKKLDQFDLANEAVATEARDNIHAAVGDGVFVLNVEKKQRKRNPAPPFITSTLQQDAVRKLGFSASRAMRIAQQLYEGVDLGSGAVGLITYMRTDSVTLAADAVRELREHIAEAYGANCVPETPRVYKSKSKNAQEAHEAIRPTSAARTPASIKQALDRDQFRLYDLIWKRAVASQMIHATLDTVTADIGVGHSTLRATGSTVREPGFMRVYIESTEDEPVKEPAKEPDGDGAAKEGGADKSERRLPPLAKDDCLALKQAEAEQHFTEPPPRYGEASLIKALEEHGIGRPSTYASIIATLQNREYTVLEKRRFHPTDIGRAVNHFLTEHFERYVDYDFTAHLEDELDEISRGERGWVMVLEEFWRPFKKLVEEKDKNVSRSEALQARTLGTDPKSGKPVSVRLGRYGPFVQIGTREDEEKPRFASLRPGQKVDSITYEEAMKLFELPRDLGETPEGEPLQASAGRYGPYIKYGSKYASLETDDPHTVTRERALEVVAAKKKADAEKVILNFEKEDIQVLNGRYGPYVTDGNKNAKIPKDQVPAELTLETCREMLEAAPVRKRRGGAKKKSRKKTPAKTKAKTKTKTETKTEGETEAETSAKAEAETEAKPKAKPKAKTKAKPKAKTKAKPKTKPKAKPETKPEANPEANPEAKTK